MIQYLLFLVLIFLIGGIIMNGIYAITRGNEIKRVDGTIKRNGKIFMSWYFFWFKEKKEKKRIQYMGVALQKLHNDFVAPLLKDTLLKNDCVYVRDNAAFEMLYAKRSKYNVEIQKTDVHDIDRESGYELKVVFYDTEAQYVYPYILRTPLAGCITCFSSIYGTIIFSVTHLLMKHDVLVDLYSWTGNVYAALFFTWVLFLFGWAYLNNLLYKIGN